MSARTLEIPPTLEAIDAAWLTAALSQKAPGLVVESFEIVDAHRHFSTVARLRLKLNDAGRAAGAPSSLILKAGYEPHSRLVYRTYLMEVEGYRDVWPVVGLRTPRCYYADADPEAERTILLIEDLALRGVTFCEVSGVATYDEVARRLTAVAELHAKTWNSPDLSAGGRFGHLLRNGAARCKQYMQLHALWDEEEAWNELAALPRAVVAPRAFLGHEFGKRVIESLGALADRLPSAIAHGDLHLKNLYWDVDGEPGFFDGNARIDAPYADLNYLIVCALDVADRRKYDLALVDHYTRALQRFGVDTTVEESLYYYKLWLMQSFYQFFFNSSYFQTEAFNTLHASRFAIAALDHNVVELLRGVRA
jgi:hypothetical protein